MFIIGATGQILTLILTVVLPMIMLVTRYPKIEIKISNINSELQLGNDNLLVDEYKTVYFSEGIRAKKQLIPAVVKNNQEDFNYTAQNDKVKWDTFYLHDSGNKAPPLFL